MLAATRSPLFTFIWQRCRVVVMGVPKVGGHWVRRNVPAGGRYGAARTIRGHGDWTLSEVTQLVPNGGRLDEELRRLEETYFDTSGARLRLFGVTLRRQVGGSETGWQLKVLSGTTRRSCKAARG